MGAVENTLLILLLILFFGLVVPELFLRLKLPYITSLLLIGAILGPHGLGYIVSNEVIEFFGFLGFTFLMLLAGLETNLQALQQSKRKIFTLAIANGVIPFVLGFGITLLFGQGIVAALLVGTIFISSSVAIIIPTIKSAGLYNKVEGQIMAAAIFIEDILSLFLLAMIFQSIDPITRLPLPLYFTVLIISVLSLKVLIPKVTTYLFQRSGMFKHEAHEDQTRFVIILLMAVLIYFSYLGVHPIVAAFIVGALLSGVTKSHVIFEKIHTLGYGLFVPVFFFIVGMEMDISALFAFDAANIFIVVLILAFLIGKILSGYFAGKSVGFTGPQAQFFSIVSTPQLTTTLAVTYAASNAGLLERPLVTGIIALSIITTVFAPIVLKAYSSRFGVQFRLRKPTSHRH